MEIFINLANDLVIIIGNIIIFSSMLNFRELKRSAKWIISISCVLFTVAYSICVYVAHVPLIYATVLCFTLPTLLLFHGFSPIKDARFFLTFGIVDTVSLIIAFITKYVAFFYEDYAPYVTLILNLIVYAAIMILGYRYFIIYAKLLKFQKAGWKSMTVATFVIYFALCFLAAYPEPMINRVEDGPSYIVFSCVVLSCYVVFIDSIIKTKKLYEQNAELEKEKEFHKIAYRDSLTGLYNRVYYVEKINELERTCDQYRTICCIVMDVNNFKIVNDRFGHHTGDQILQDMARHISDVFRDLSPLVFRIGGDEFYIMLLDVREDDIRNRLEKVNQLIAHNDKVEDNILSIASGYSIIDVENDHPRRTIEQNFIQADHNMYENKNEYKTAHPCQVLDYESHVTLDQH